VIEKYGADALRLYLINSPVVRAETLRFKEDGVFAVVKDVFLPWYNAYRFLVQNVQRYEAEHPEAAPFDAASVDLAAAGSNVLDRWIAAAARRLVNYVRAEMGAYRLYTVVPYLVQVTTTRCLCRGVRGCVRCVCGVWALCFVGGGC
jgi:isoleucyl-tRNA synthetase